MFHHFVFVQRNNPFQNLVGHDGHVMSIDFHPTKLSLLSSCDSNGEIRLWDVKSGDCKLNFKVGVSIFFFFSLDVDKKASLYDIRRLHT